MSRGYAIVNHNEKFFLNLCGHYSLVDSCQDATIWDEEAHKEMWFYVQELKASTNQSWYVKDLSFNRYIKTPPVEARTVIVSLHGTWENEDRQVVLEPETFGEVFAGKKFKPLKVWYYEIFTKGTKKFIPVAEVDGKYYRYKNSLRDMKDSYTEEMWLW